MAPKKKRSTATATPVPATTARVEIDGDSILQMLERDVDADAKPVVDFRSLPPVPPILDRVFAEVIREFVSRRESRSTTVKGGGRRAEEGGFERVVKTVKSYYTEYVPSRSKAKDACLQMFKDRSFLGSGRYGVVYNVVDPSDVRPGYRYAVKTVFLYPFAHRMLYENLVNEIEIAKKMGEAGVGPGVRAVHWCEQDGGVLVMIVVDLMSRGDLAHFSQTHAVTSKHVAAIERKIKKMHRMGYLHNDVHARNVLVHDRDEGGFDFYLSDFGFSSQDSDPDKRKEEVKRVRSLTSMATRDRLRGLLYNMMVDGRIRTSIRFRQSPAASSAVWLEGSTYDASGTRTALEYSGSQPQ